MKHLIHQTVVQCQFQLLDKQAKTEVREINKVNVTESIRENKARIVRRKSIGFHPENVFLAEYYHSPHSL